MIRIFVGCLMFTITTGISVADPPAKKTSEAPLPDEAKDDFGFQSLPLFDGQTLAGWEGNVYWFSHRGRSGRCRATG